MTRAFAGRAPWGGSRAGGEAEREHTEPQQRGVFACPAGHEFEVPFAQDAELPDAWDCRNHGLESQRLAAQSQAKQVKPPRTHWDMLLERRSIGELEVLLDEALDKLRGRHQ